MAEGKVLIYGATGGIGKATAERLRQEGCSLHLVGRDEARLQPMAATFDASYTIGDVKDEDTFVRVTEDAGSELQGLVYAVGTLNLRSLRQLTPHDFLNDFQINAAGAAQAVRAALSALRKGNRPTSIVLYSSVAATQGFANHASIGMAKAAVSGLTLSLAAELAPAIRVNAIAPSLTDTPLAEPLTSNDKMKEAIENFHALPRLGTAQEMAALTSFLLSADAHWITGQIIGADGGRSSLRIRS